MVRCAHTVRLVDVFRALSFAARAHRDQVRKGTGEPYVNHLIDVVELLVRIGQVDDAEVLAAAALHDVIEDTNTSAADIESVFGRRVRNIVEALTDDKQLSKAERKRQQIEHMRSAERAVQMIKLADHCSNVATLPSSWPLERKLEYLEWSRQVAQACAGASAPLEDEHRQRLERARRSESGA